MLPDDELAVLRDANRIMRGEEKAMMIHLTKTGRPFDGRALDPLTWDDWQWGSDPPIHTALVTCANGHTGTVAPHVHKIATDGLLTPSWVCPFEGCSWHEFAQLDGWQP